MHAVISIQNTCKTYTRSVAVAVFHLQYCTKFVPRALQTLWPQLVPTARGMSSTWQVHPGTGLP